MNICTTVAEMRAAAGATRGGGKRLGLVPTMGALHEGHLSLVRAAKDQSDVVAVSIFVNPTQFGPNEDFSKYPRTFERDCELLQNEGVELVFAPPVDEMYPRGAVTYVTVEGLSDKLCGRSRPGHFRGVTTVVAKLFHIIEPDLALFGQKDAAQAAIIPRMVRDLDLAVRIVVCPIVREPDGLAMSSRNAYLNPAERQAALVLWRALRLAAEHLAQGERQGARLAATLCDCIAKEPLARIDYVAVCDPDTLREVEQLSGTVLVVLAVYIGKTRLIDNAVLSVGD